MRIWDVDVAELCDQHLLGEHRELHAIWSILTAGKRGYANHPETLRWSGRLAALHDRHRREVEEMSRRGFRHHSPLDALLAVGDAHQTELLEPLDAQRRRLVEKDCGCPRQAATALVEASVR